MLVKVLTRIYSICAKLLLMRKWVFLCLLFLPFLSSAAEREIRIGLIDTFDQDFYLETFVPTIEHIQKIAQRLDYNVNFQRFPTLDAKKLVNAPKMSAHHRGICHF